MQLYHVRPWPGITGSPVAGTGKFVLPHTILPASALIYPLRQLPACFSVTAILLLYSYTAMLLLFPRNEIDYKDIETISTERLSNKFTKDAITPG